MLKDLLIKARSVRSFEKTPISNETLEKLVEYCRFTPSTANLQALKFCCVSEENKVQKVFENTAWAGYLKDEKIPPTGSEPTAFIIICHDKEISKNVTGFYKDTGICAQTIVLGAAEMEIGACMIGSFKEEQLKTILSLSENLEITLVIALGYPAEFPKMVDCENGDIKYYRENGQHYVPKRALSEILIK